MVDDLWQDNHFHLESTLDLIQDLNILLRGNEWYGGTLCSKSSCSTNSVEILIGIRWHVKVDNNVDLLNIDTSTDKIGCNTDSVLTLLEVLVDLQCLLLFHASMESNRWESLLLNKFIQNLSILLWFHENDDLIEIELIQQFYDLLDLLVII